MTHRSQYVVNIFREAAISKILCRSLLHPVYKSEAVVNGCLQVSLCSSKGPHRRVLKPCDRLDKQLYNSVYPVELVIYLASRKVSGSFSRTANKQKQGRAELDPWETTIVTLGISSNSLILCAPFLHIFQQFVQTCEAVK